MRMIQNILLVIGLAIGIAGVAWLGYDVAMQLTR